MKNAMIAAIISVVALGVALVAPAKADEWDKLTKVTVSGPVEIPGQVLPAGTYWFKLLDSPSDRNIVQIFNADQNKVFATILAIPDYRMRPTGKTVITFEERAANAPEAIKAWFYPGDNYGQEFVYPKPRAMQLAKLGNANVPSMPANLERNTKMAPKTATEPSVVAMKKAPVKIEQPSGGEVEVGQVIQTPPQLAQNNPETQTPPPAAPASNLPATAGEMPLVGLAGLILASAGGVLLRITSKRLN